MSTTTRDILATIPNTACSLLATVHQSLSQVAAVRAISKTQEGSRLGEFAAQFATTNVSATLTPEVAYTRFFRQAGTFMDDVEVVLGALRTEVGLTKLKEGLNPPTLRELGYFFYELSIPQQLPGEDQDGLALDTYRRISRLNQHSEVVKASACCFELARELEERK